MHLNNFIQSQWDGVVHFEQMLHKLCVTVCSEMLLS